MNAKQDHQTVDELAGREGLSVEETLALAAARRATEPVERTRVERNGWTVEFSHHTHTGRWFASAWRAGTTFSGERIVANNVGEPEARAAAEAFLDSPPR